MPWLLFVHHTPSPALQEMFEAAVSGAPTDEIEDVEVVIRPALTAAPVDVLQADGYLLGTPVQLALVPLRRALRACDLGPHDEDVGQAAAALIALLRNLRPISAVDPGLAVDRGYGNAPDRPQSPDPPR
jgi:hypothetical protein